MTFRIMASPSFVRSFFDQEIGINHHMVGITASHKTLSTI